MDDADDFAAVRARRERQVDNAGWTPATRARFEAEAKARATASRELDASLELPPAPATSWWNESKQRDLVKRMKYKLRGTP